MKKKKTHPAVSKFYSELAIKGWKKRHAKLIKQGVLKITAKQ